MYWWGRADQKLRTFQTSWFRFRNLALYCPWAEQRRQISSGSIPMASESIRLQARKHHPLQAQCGIANAAVPGVIQILKINRDVDLNLISYSEALLMNATGAPGGHDPLIHEQRFE